MSFEYAPDIYLGLLNIYYTILLFKYRVYISLLTK